MRHTDGHRCILPRAPSTVLWDLLLQNRRKQRAKLCQQHISFCSGSNQRAAGGFLVGQFLCVRSELDFCTLPKSDVPNPPRFQQQEEQCCPKGSCAGWLSSAGVALAERFKAVFLCSICKHDTPPAVRFLEQNLEGEHSSLPCKLPLICQLKKK